MATTGSTSFRPGWPLTIAVAIVAAILVGLGTWQVDRLGWKLDLIERMEAGLALDPVPFDSLDAGSDQLDYRKVTVEGRLDWAGTQAHGSFTRQGRIGARALVPLERDGAPSLLVDMGWIPEPVSDALADLRARPAEERRIEGYLRLDHLGAKPAFRPDNDPDAGRWYWKDTPALARATGQDTLLPMTLVRLPEGEESAPPIATAARVDLPNNHLGYAITWYGLCVALLGVYLVFGRMRARESSTR